MAGGTGMENGGGGRKGKREEAIQRRGRRNGRIDEAKEGRGRVHYRKEHTTQAPSICPQNKDALFSILGVYVLQYVLKCGYG